HFGIIKNFVLDDNRRLENARNFIRVDNRPVLSVEFRRGFLSHRPKRKKTRITRRKRSPAPRTNLGHVSTENLKDAFSGRIIDRETEFLELSKNRRLEIDNEEIKEDYLKRILK
ncbi:MAG: hypothetical protein IJ530_05475, partial [Treponema sp.]|nr:hypothetical protein [Treponema sp.]